MGKNVIIFSDGTGQRGGVLVDEDRSNIYKLYRATRCGPESQVDPAKQVAFYDPGVGTLPAALGGFSSFVRRVYNLVSQALGLGLTGNMIDCYAALLRLYRPGDDIYLFGFSRGGYTVRCLAAVIAQCGVATRLRDGSPMRYDDETTRRIASEAVKTVYQHTSSWKADEHTTERQKELLAQRVELARRFRQAYASGTDKKANVYPHFVGVFDTVASLSNPVALIILILVGLFLVAILGTALWATLAVIRVFSWSFATWFGTTGILITMVVGGGFAITLAMRVRSEIGLSRRKWWRFFHLTEPRMNFYDTQLNPNVNYARHAISIDEARDSFQLVEWTDPRRAGTEDVGDPNPERLVQLCFPGNHADIGGGYPERESRLSDIPFAWMVEAAGRCGLIHDPALLRLYPDPAGPQHDETQQSAIFRRAGKSVRQIAADFPLHDSVIDRFKAGKVLIYDRLDDYRPENLRRHSVVGPYY